MDYNIPDNNMTSRRGIFAIGVFLSGLLAAWLGFKLGGSHLTKPDMVFGIGCAFLAMGVGMFTLRDGAYPAKAKRNVAVASLAKDRGAVSPVIGVILMVAITVVLAAIVFVLVSNLSKNSNTQAPNIAFNQDDSHHTLVVVQADAAADWGQVKVAPMASGCTYHLGNAAGTSASRITIGSQAIVAGDTITVAGTAGSQCTLSLSYASANQLLGSWTFTF